jgi:hypothetical protein
MRVLLKKSLMPYVPFCNTAFGGGNLETDGKSRLFPLGGTSCVFRA